MALATVLLLGACKASGGGYIGAPLDGPPGEYEGRAHFGFNFTCQVDRQDQVVIRGNLTYHDKGVSTIDVPVDPDDPSGPVVATEFPEIRLHGTVDPTSLDDATTCEEAAESFPDGALFEGSYRPQGPRSGIPDDLSEGRFIVQVFDQGEPGRTTDPAFATGDGFSIELVGGAYNGYTRAGYIEGGNIQSEG